MKLISEADADFTTYKGLMMTVLNVGLGLVLVVIEYRDFRNFILTDWKYNFLH